MRILFIHAAREYAPEYDVHYTLAAYADPDAAQCYFVQQSGASHSQVPNPASNDLTSHILYWDFGRNLSIEPRPTRLRRALMMALRLPPSLIYLIRVIHKIRPDVIYTSQQGYDIILTRLVRCFFRRPHVIHLHYQVGSWLGRPAYATIRKARHLLAVSNFVRDGAIHAGVNPRHIDTLHNPLRPRSMPSPMGREALRTLLGLPVDVRIVIAVGRLDPGKGHLQVLEAFARVCQEAPAVHLVICGRTFSRHAYDQEIRSKAHALGIGTRVTFAGHRNDIPQLLAASDVFCLPTVDEPLGLVFLEAMEAGLPCVACRSGGVPEVILDEETGLLSEPGDVPMLAENLARLLRDQELASRLGAAGQRRVHAVFAAQLIAATWVRLLNKHFYPAAEQPMQAHPDVTATSLPEANHRTS